MKTRIREEMKRSAVGLAVLGISLIVFPARLNAWCADGHRLIEQIAWYYMSSAVKDSVQKQLQDFVAGTGEKPETHTGNHPDYQKHLRCLAEADQSAVNPKPALLLSRTELLIYNLKNRYGTPAQRGEQLMTLMFLLGDLHQPLQATSDPWGHGFRYPVDQSDREESLYQVWHQLLLRSAGVNVQTCLAIRFNKAVWRAYYSSADDDKSRALKPISNDPRDWQEVSSHLLLFIQPEPNANINRSYLLKCKPILELQLHNAGLNLANVLRKIYSGA